MRPGKFKIGFPRVLVLVGDPIPVEKTKPNLAAAKALTDRIEAAVEELRKPHGPPAHAWYPPREPALSASGLTPARGRSKLSSGERGPRATLSHDIAQVNTRSGRKNKGVTP